MNNIIDNFFNELSLILFLDFGPCVVSTVFY